MVEIGAFDFSEKEGGDLVRATRLVSTCNEIEVCAEELMRLISYSLEKWKAKINNRLVEERKENAKIEAYMNSII